MVSAAHHDQGIGVMVAALGTRVQVVHIHEIGVFAAGTAQRPL
jgi:hypothetical protein